MRTFQQDESIATFLAAASPSSRGSSPTPTSSPVSDYAGNGQWWRLAWCHERCHKDEHKDRRDAARDILQEHGGSLWCFKKAARFGQWINRSRNQPFALVTDWREAQGSVAALRDGQVARPIIIVILCISQRQQRAAAAWARGLQSDLPIHACEYTNIPKELLAGLVQEIFSGMAPPTPSPTSVASISPAPESDDQAASNGEIEDAADIKENRAGASLVGLPLTSPPRASPNAAEMPAWAEDEDTFWDKPANNFHSPTAVGKMQFQYVGSNTPMLMCSGHEQKGCKMISSVATPTDALTTVTPVAHLAHILGYNFHHKTALQLEADLLRAQPVVYED